MLQEKAFGCDQPVRELTNFGRPFCRNTQDLRLIRIAMGITGIAGRVRVAEHGVCWQARAIFFLQIAPPFSRRWTPLAITPVRGAERSASVCKWYTYTVQHTDMVHQPVCQRSNATPTPRPCRPVFNVGYRRAVKVGAVMRLTGLYTRLRVAGRRLLGSFHRQWGRP